MNKKTGMAIPLVLGFIFVAMILGSTLIFSTRVRVADTRKAFKRLQHRHLAQSGLNIALAEIKQQRISKIIETKGRSWNLFLPRQKFGKAEGWCEVNITAKSQNELVVRSDAFWHVRGSKPEVLNFSCNASYREFKNRQFSGRVKIHGEWKLRRFRQEANDQS